MLGAIALLTAASPFTFLPFLALAALLFLLGLISILAPPVTLFFW
jgi:hypothetical protein